MSSGLALASSPQVQQGLPHIVTPESVVQSVVGEAGTGATIRPGTGNLGRRQDKVQRRRQFDDGRQRSQQSTRPGSPTGDNTDADDAEHPRILLSARGEKVYVGSSAAISFLQFLRRLLRHYGGQSAFTESRTRHHMLENTVQESYGEFEDFLDHAERVALIRCFYASTSGFLCMFSDEEITHLLGVYEGTKTSLDVGHNRGIKQDDLASLYLVLAIGARCRGSNESDKRVASTFFAQGQQITFRDMLHDPTISMVTNFILMSFYMFASSRRNTGLLYLGVASKAATILGLHVMELNKGLRPETARRRVSAWKSLRTLDVQCNAILGRPSSTPHVASETWRGGVGEKPTHRSLAVNANFDLSLLMEPISQKLTKQAALDLDAAETHLQKLRAWAKSLPEPLRQSIRKARRDVPTYVHLEHTIGNIHVACAYYFGVMLVTRHFLIATLTPKLKQSDPSRLEDLREAGGTEKTTELSNVCVEAAVHLVQMCADALDRDLLLDNMCILQAWVFAASLVLGFSQLVASDEYHQDAPQAFLNSLRVVERFSSLSAQSQRNHEILTSFSSAIDAYHAKREREKASAGNPYLEQIIRPVESSMPSNAQDGLEMGGDGQASSMQMGPGVDMGAAPMGDFGDFNAWPEMQNGFLVPQMNDEIGFQLFWDGYSPPLPAGMQMQNDDMSMAPWT
ncbi:hypothetical protein NLU13_0999 [Sarocladium strictum]|uniref:Xylanolytic transcriptional activator regulatory domain-containing protein n=1 Tax=Sarocladium strictum TaxID=5046 RepID=A0AA39GRL0_SARSR|nr:hypothetical protein NLU13_0999 [Sarocladium strictum]